MTQISEADAVARYPELELLRTIKAAGWTFRTRLDGAGELLAIVRRIEVRGIDDDGSDVRLF